METNRLNNLLQLLQEQPEDAFLIYAAALEYERLEDRKNAEVFFEKLFSAHPNYLPTYYKAAQFYADAGAFEKALTIIGTGKKLAMEQKDSKTLREMNELEQWLEEEV